SLAAAFPDAEHFHMYSEQLIKPLMQTLTHQHSRVRVAAVLTTGAVVRYGCNKSVNDALPHLAQRLFDDASTVRQAVTDVVGTWLLELPDRYSFFHKLIPLLLSSLSDEMPDVRNSATEYWKRVGQQWEHENEEDLKDKMDFELPPSSLYPAGVARPCLGCRELVQRNLSRVLPAVARDAGDWVVGTRAKASQLLVWLTVHAEDHATQHAELLVATLHRTCADDEPQVVHNAVRSAELLGAFVNPEVFCKLALPALHRSPSPSHLAPISAFIRGSSAETSVDPILEDRYKKWRVCEPKDLPIVLPLAITGPMVGEFLPEVMPIFRDLLQPSKEPELRLKVFAVLSKLLLNAQETVNSQGQFAGFLQELVREMIVPNLVWHAGRTAAAIRTTAVSCLWALLHGGMVTPEQASAVSGELLPQAVAMLDEDSKTSRLLACRALRIVLQLLSEKGCDADALNKIYPEVLKRLDDASDEVRIAAARCLSAWFGCVGGDYDRGLYRAHLEFLYRGLLVHLDDPDAGIQAAVLDVLKQGGRVTPELLQQEVEAVKHKHRSPLHCDALVQHLQQLTST
uniref:Dynein axonemal assembly factor 5 n=1 Tax=Petromyzon marinus TaxID=7757 RepID=S4RX24_PETMA